VARVESYVSSGTRPKLRAPRGARPKSANQVMKELRRAWWSDRLGGGHTASLCIRGGQTA
jgi:hypothetical protein